jgi:hypothetical protein
MVKITFPVAAILGVAFVLGAISLFDLRERGSQPN